MDQIDPTHFVTLKAISSSRFFIIFRELICNYFNMIFLKQKAPNSAFKSNVRHQRQHIPIQNISLVKLKKIPITE